MKLGLVARAEDRGLGNLLWEAYRHLQPDRTLLIDPGVLARGFAQHAGRYPDATVAGWDGQHLDERLVRRWLAGLDVVYTAETAYDWRLFQWAREAGVRSVLHVMPEFHQPARVAVPPDVWWTPTTWRLGHLPHTTRVVPVPVAADRLAGRQRGGCATVLHVAGHRAAGDRNGTQVLLQAVRYLREPVRVVLVGQDGALPAVRPPDHVELVVRAEGVADYWRLYDDGDLLVLPRRYGGLCLPAQEGMAAGLGLVMSDVEPQRSTWPAVLVGGCHRGELQTPSGPVPLFAANPMRLGATIDHLVANPQAAADASRRSLRWAADHTWQALGGLWAAELAAVAE